MPQAHIFLDTCILFDALEDRRTHHTLRHAANDGCKIRTSITVMGEFFSVCLEEGRLQELGDIRAELAEWDCGFIHPSLQVRGCCICLDNQVQESGTYGSSLTDRTHLAYAVASNCEYFVTSPGETRSLDLFQALPCTIEVVDIEGLRTSLGYR